MKEKILAAIKAKFPTVKLHSKRLDALSASIEAEIGTDETLIDTQLDALNKLYPLAEIAKDDHSRSSLEGRLKAAQPPKDKESSTTETEVKEDPDMPAWAKALIEQNKALSAGIAAIQGEKQQLSIKAKAAEKLKDVPEIFWSKRGLPDKDENLEAFIEEVQTDYQAFAKEQTDKGFSSIPIPGSGGNQEGKPAKVKEASKEELDKLAVSMGI